MQGGSIADGLKAKLQSFGFCQLKGLLYSLVIRWIIKKTGNNRPVAAMTFISAGEGIVKDNFCFLRGCAEQLKRRTSNPYHPGSVRAGRSNHYRTDHVKNTAFLTHTG